jgi:nucleotide-binding universal stress UspA family protein
MAFSMLVTLDGSAWSEGVLTAAERIAREAHAKVYLLRLYPPVHGSGQTDVVANATTGSPEVGLGVPPEVMVRQVESTTQAAERGSAEALAYLQPIARRFGGLEVEPIARESGHLADDIVATAQRLNVDLIAMATHGRSGIAHVLLGSVAEAVVRTAGVPVLLVRPTEDSGPGS